MNDSDSPYSRRAVRTAAQISTALIAMMVNLSTAAAADPAPFELTGPDLRIEVTRGQQTLPIAQVPSLAEGDRVSVHAALPDDQGLKFLMVSAFLRGATNPPPKGWISTASTWKSKEKDKALSLTVPKGARQMVLLMVPDTGGAEGALVDAVRGKPGEFVRASQDLNQASLDHSRLIAFMTAIKAQDNNAPEYLRTVAPVLARSLSIKLNEDCLSKVIEMQASCLLENRESLVLSDVHSSSIADTLTGTPTDLALQLSATPEAGAGYYSAYIGVARDIARIFGAFSNPQFGYLPTLSVRRDDTLSLLLNTAPSFQKPKSVMVVALPAVETDIPPQLRNTAKGPVCVVRPGAVLPVEGAPLIFSTAFAHEVGARLSTASGQSAELPLVPRADKGGFVLGSETIPSAFTGTIRARIHGIWGFSSFDGPEFLLQRPDGSPWKIAGDADGLVAGRDNDVVLEGAAPSCVEEVGVRQASGALQPVDWKVQEANRLVVTIPKAAANAGEIRMEVRYQGARNPETIALRARVEASRIENFEIHAGDLQGELTGQRLDQVQSLTMGETEYRPDGLVRDHTVDRLRLVAQDAAPGSATSRPKEGEAAKVVVRLVDGRSVVLPMRVEPPRPQVELLGRTVYPAPAAGGTRALELGGSNILPDSGELVFSVKAVSGGRFDTNSTIEIAPEDGATSLRLASGKGLTLESRDVLVGRLKAADLPPGSFGPLRFRLVNGRDMTDWKPLAVLARLPRIDALTCPTKGGSDPNAKPCSLQGRDLFLIGAISPQPGFAQGVEVPAGFTGSELDVPQPIGGKLYLRLRDAPDDPVILR